MNKILKLAALMAVCIGVVIGIFSLLESDYDPQTEDMTWRYSEIRDIIASDFASMTNWDRDVYSKKDSLIAAEKYDERITYDEMINLKRELLTLTATFITTQLEKEYRKSDCSSVEVKRLYTDLVGIAGDQKSYWDDAGDLLQTHQRIYEKYKEIIDFVDTRKYDISAKITLKKGNLTWQTWEDGKKAWNETRRGLSDNTYYKEYLSNITKLSNGLLEGAVNRKIITKEEYAEKVCDNIIDYFETQDANEENKELYASTVTVFENQFYYTDYTLCDRLQRDYQDFASRVATTYYNPFGY
jgi:hypothetical protein